MKSKVIYLDTETTGMDIQKSGIIQIAGVVEINDKIKEKINITSNIFPEDIYEESAAEKHGITLDKVKKFQPPASAFRKLISILEKYVNRYDSSDKFIVVGYFAEFDNQMLRSWFLKNGDKYYGSWFWHPWIDVANLVAYMYQDRRSEIKSFKLSDVCAFMGIEPEGDFHDALSDIEVTRQIYKELTK